MKLYGLIGGKLGHSFSARYFNSKFADENIDAHYDLHEIEDIAQLPGLIAGLPALRGLNVTIPYKQEVLPYLHSLTDSAKEIGAVNTIRVVQHPGLPPRLSGHNTDAPGFSMAIEPLLCGRRKALVLGQGGASKAVIHALRRLGICVTRVSRTKSDTTLTYSDLSPEIMAEHDIIVNCTPLGMYPDVESAPDIPYELLSSRHLCFDLVYNPETTEFMRRAAQRGAIVSNGLQMLINQAELAWRFWNEGETRRYMSRHIELRYADGATEIHTLAIAAVHRDASGEITDVQITPFTHELPSVEYLDTPLILNLPYPHP